MNWYLGALKKYAEFEGRARRTEYWMFCLISFGISVGLAVVESLVGSPGILGGLFSLAMLIPGLAVGVRRLHDTGRSGWWWLLSFTCVGIIPLLIFMALAGNEGNNEYGADPKA